MALQVQTSAHLLRMTVSNLLMRMETTSRDYNIVNCAQRKKISILILIKYLIVLDIIFELLDSEVQ